MSDQEIREKRTKRAETWCFNGTWIKDLDRDALLVFIGYLCELQDEDGERLWKLEKAMREVFDD